MDNSSKRKDKKRKKKKKSQNDDEDIIQNSIEYDTSGTQILVSTNSEMPEGARLSDDDDDFDEKNHDDPHKALGAINLDDLESDRFVSKTATASHLLVEEKKVKKSGNNKKKRREEEVKENLAGKKSSKKKKKKKSLSDQKEGENPKDVIMKNGENGITDDYEFWLSPSKSVKEATKVPKIAGNEIKESKKKPKKKKKSKDKEECQANGLIPDLEDNSPNSTNGSSSLALKILAANKSLKMLYDVRRVPMDPEKMTAGISFKNVGEEDISSVEIDFVNTPAVEIVKNDEDNGIRINMDLQKERVEDHLFLFKVCSINKLSSSQFCVECTGKRISSMNNRVDNSSLVSFFVKVQCSDWWIWLVSYDFRHGSQSVYFSKRDARRKTEQSKHLHEQLTKPLPLFSICNGVWNKSQ